jgi:hypothetical protein
MAIKTEEFSKDPLSRAIPGQSFTDTPGKNLYEKPAMTAAPKQALDAIISSLEDPASLETVLGLLDAGLSTETVASALVLKMFSEGVFTPDVAEIIKPALVAHLTQLAIDAGIEDVNVINDMPSAPINSQDTLQLMKKLSPTKYARKVDNFVRDEDDAALAAQIDLPESPEEDPERQSFLDMEVA